MLDVLIHHPVLRYADETPDHPALSIRGEIMTYAQLAEASGRLSGALLARGLARGDRVGIFLHKSVEMGIGVYGALRAGGVFVPLDPMMPVDRLAYIVRDCGIGHLVTSDLLAPTVARLDPTIPMHVFGTSETPFTGLSWEEIDGGAIAPPVDLVDQDLGYIMYTSGSTGMPKGMMHSHRGSVAYARWGEHFAGLRSMDRVASHAPLHFDLSVFDFFSTARAGATVVLVPEGVTKFPASLTRYLEDERATHLFTVPHTLIEMVERGAMEDRDLSSLRHVLFGGEPFPPKHLRDVMERLPGARFTNVYGPAEAPCCTVYDVPGPPQSDDPLPIGTVSKNSRGLVVDDDGTPAPVGVPGELCIRSTTLTLGYWNRPELNEGAYLLRKGPGPFPEVWYRTGDIVMAHEDGLLRFLGRRDRMVKTRGHRVELAEVEAALVGHPEVFEAAAFAIDDGRGSRQIEAALTTRPDATVHPGEVMAHARRRLPPYALPVRIFVVDDLPRTRNGKIDYNELADGVSQ